MNEITVGIIGLAVLLLLFSTGIELGFAMALVGFVGFAYLNGFSSAMNLIRETSLMSSPITGTRSSLFSF